MKVKSLITLLLFFVYQASSYAQLKVDTYGRIGMGTNTPNLGYKCHIKGNLLLTTYPSSPLIEFQFKVGNGLPGTEIGSTVDQIAFWSSWTSYNKLYAEQYYRMSDINFKQNQTPILSPLAKINELKPYKYDLADPYFSESGDSLIGTLSQYGFISQEIEESLPEIKITEDGKDGKLMDYDQIIPLLVAGIQEQQKAIKGLEAQIAKLIATNPNYNSNSGGIGNQNNPMNMCRLLPCSPNPFITSTELNYYLNSNLSQAEIRVYNMQGFEKKIFNLNLVQGNAHVILQGIDLPMSGNYIYALFIDGQIIDAKPLVKQ